MERPAELSTLAGMGPLVSIVFLGFMAIAIPLAPLSLEVHDHLGFAAGIVGLTIGLQSLITVMSRHTAGSLSDRLGSRTVVLMGLPIAVAAGGAYMVSTYMAGAAALMWIMAGRVLLGIAESLFITGAMTWGIARIGPHRTGRVMAWQGISMYTALTIGAPLGLALQRHFGFEAVAMAAMGAPLLAMAIAGMTGAAPIVPGKRAPLHHVIGMIWRQGVVLSLASIPFAAVMTFLTLYYTSQGWGGAGLALAGSGVGYIVIRLFFAHLPDKVGGVPVASVSLMVQAAGQVVLLIAPHPAVAFVGAVITGCGVSLIFPAMGVEATRHVPAAQRGQAVGNFIAFFDIAMGLTGPIVGLLIATPLGYHSAFLTGALSAAAALILLKKTH
ncbi:MAG: MFS transporter [Planctomycetes bacterium]|nr:MFS transporter [Planctomycetota bacterium]